MIDYLYICSAGHSGSTLLDLLLGAHSKIESLGEISHLPKNISLNTICTCGSSVKNCEVWKPVIERISHRLDSDVMNSPYSLLLGYPKASVVIDKTHQTRRYLLKRKVIRGLRFLQLKYRLPGMGVLLKSMNDAINNSFLLSDAVIQVTKKKIVIDSSKDYLKAVGLYLANPKRVKVILLTRDGRGVLYSHLKRQYSFEHGVNPWLNYYSRAVPLLNQYVNSSDLLQVKYENLSADPANELIKICNFAGVHYEPAMLNYSDHVHHITNGNDMRFVNKSTIKADTAWKTKLSTIDKQLFDKLAGATNHILGYE